jgi:hypothetical protein
MKWRIGIILLLLFGIGVLFIYAKLKVVSLVPDLSLPISASELTITSPTTGTVVVPGQTIPVSVSARSTFQAIQVIGENIGITPPKQNPPYSFVLTVPNNIAGPKKIVALGITGPDDEVFSPPVIVDIESQTSLTDLTVTPSLISFDHIGDQVNLTSMGRSSDGTETYLTNSTKMVYHTNDTTIANVSSDGVVTASGKGTTSILVKYGSMSAVVPVTVRGAAR